MDAKRAAFEGSMSEFFESWYETPGIPDRGTLAAAKAP
jgi:hypothetical protein